MGHPCQSTSVRCELGQQSTYHDQHAYNEHDCLLHKSGAVLQMLDADDAILEQAMQTGAALKKARDLQKAARKPKVRPRPVYQDSSHMHACAYIAAIPPAHNTASHTICVKLRWQPRMCPALSGTQTELQTITTSHMHLRVHMVEIGHEALRFLYLSDLLLSAVPWLVG